MILFEAQIQEHQSLAQHYRELAAYREALAAELLAVQEQADASLLGLKSLLEKCRDASPNAIASLKSAVLNLFPGDENDDSGGNDPTEPTDPTPPDSPDSDEPDATEAPKVGQACELSCELPAASIPLIELVTHPENEHVAYQRKGDGEIICTYVGFRTKAIAQSWREFVEALAFHVELRQSKRMQGFKWELKCKGISMQQIDRLAKNCDLAKSHRTEVCSSLPPSYKKPLHPTPFALDEVKPGDIVSPLLAPGDSYEVLQVMPNGILDCKSLRTGVQMGLKPVAVTLVQKAVTQEPEAPRHQLQSGNRVVKSGVVRERSTFHKIPSDELVRVSLLPEATTGDDAFDF